MILQSKFIDRDRELKYLMDRYNQDNAQLILLYGRRRIGKTYLLQKFISEVGGLYLLAEESENVLDDFSARLANFFNDRFLYENPLQSWGAFFTYLSEKARNEKVVVVIDEVQYIVKTNREFLSSLQKYWDTALVGSRIMLVLCSSQVSFMEGVMSYKSPIYGRRTGAWELDEMHYIDCAKFYDLSPEDVLRIHSVFGGVPQYWSDYNPSKDFWDNIRELLLSKGAKYYDEPRYILKMELREVARYFSILRAIATGYTTFGKIADKSRIEKNSLGKYLSVLENLGYVEIEHPIGGKRKGIYRIKDNLFNFWFRFVYPHRSEIEMSIDIVPEIQREFNAYVGERFERIAEEFLRLSNVRGKLPETYTTFGRWWHRDEEIDIVAVGKESVMFAEVKWSDLNTAQTRKVLRELKRKSDRVPIEKKRSYYAIIARKIENKESTEDNVFLYDLDDLFTLAKSD